jgi:hypothetical protein
VIGPGNNAVYTIVAWVGVRIMEVQMTGGDKHLIIQPATVITKGTIEGGDNSSQFIYSRPVLVQ